jgi:hypothetical protein
VKKTRSVGFLLSLVIGSLILILLAVFAVIAKGVNDRARENARVASVVSVLQNVVEAREALRSEQGIMSTALAELRPTDADQRRWFVGLHSRSNVSVHAIERRVMHLGWRGPELARLSAARRAHDRIFVNVLDATTRPGSQRPAGIDSAWMESLFVLVAALDAQAAPLSRHVAGTGPFMSEMMRISDIAWQLRATAGDDRRSVSNLIQAKRVPGQDDLQHMWIVTG